MVPFRAVLADLVRSLFDDRVATDAADLRTDPLSPLLPEEADALPSAHESRLLEFRGGRHCARRALARLGAPGLAILRAQDRSPVWPPGFVGSISHTRSQDLGVCAVAVARAADVRAIGLDLELDEPLDEALWRRVLRAEEREALLRRPASERGALGKLVFSAKESVYKCQHPVTKTFLEFADVRVTLPGPEGAFAAHLCRDAGPLPAGTEFVVRFFRGGSLVGTGTTLSPNA